MNQSNDSVKSITLRGILVLDRCNNIAAVTGSVTSIIGNLITGRGRFRATRPFLFDPFAALTGISSGTADVRKFAAISAKSKIPSYSFFL